MKAAPTSQADGDQPFPYFQLSILLSTGFASGIALTGLFPYVSYMSCDCLIICAVTGGDINRAGYISGFIASSFMMGRLLSSFYWGRVADRIGRKPVFYIASVSIAVMSLIFGFAVNIYMAIAARLLLGLLNPITGLIKTVVSELCIERHQPFAMSVVSASWSIGLVIGPAVGGYTSRPAEQYPDSFLASLSLFQDFPYLLPNLITAVLSMASMCMIFFFLPETLPESDIVKAKASGGGASAYEMVRVLSDEEKEAEPEADDEEDSERNVDLVMTDVREGRSVNGEGFFGSFLDLLRIEAVRVSVLAYFILSYISIIYDELLPLWALSEQHKGGLGYSSRHIGLLLSLTGFPMALFTVFIFPHIANNIGRIQCYRYGQLSFAICSFCAVMVPIVKCYVWPGMPLFAAVLVCSSFAKMSTCMAFTSNFLLINSSVAAGKRASVNGLAMTFGSIAKALGPACGSVIFAWSINNPTHILPSSLSYLFCFLLNLLLAMMTFQFCQHPACQTGWQLLKRNSLSSEMLAGPFV